MPHARNLRRILPAVSAIFVDMMSYSLITPMIVAAFSNNVFLGDSSPEMQQIMLGLSFALFPLGMFFGAAFLGDLSDRWGRKKTLMICMTGLLAAFVLMALAVAWQTITLLLAGRVLSGFMSGTTAISTAAIIDLSSEDEKAGNIAKVTLANVSAHIVGPGAGGLLADYHMQWPFIMISAMALVSLLWIALGLKETHTTSPSTAFDWLRPFHGLRDAFTNKSVRKISLVQFLTQLGNCMCYQFFFIYMAEKMGYSPGELGWFGAITIGVAAILMLCGGTERLQKRFSEKQLIAFNLPLAGVLAWVFIFIPGEASKWITAFLWASAFITCYVCIVKLFSDSATEENQGWAMGIFWAVFASGFFFGGLTASFTDCLGVELLLFTGGVMMVLGGICSLKLINPDTSC